MVNTALLRQRPAILLLDSQLSGELRGHSPYSCIAHLGYPAAIPISSFVIPHSSFRIPH